MCGSELGRCWRFEGCCSGLARGREGEKLECAVGSLREASVAVLARCDVLEGVDATKKIDCVKGGSKRKQLPGRGRN
jgi:hypothetical protein